MDPTAQSLIDGLTASQSDAELAVVRKRLAPDEPAIGIRMGRLFELAKSHSAMPLGEVDRLFADPAYEPRLAACCILDFKARRNLTDGQRRELYDLYLARHDRITTWDMVDRAAPRVVGAYLAGRPKDSLHELARAADPPRRRTAITAPLYFVRYGSQADVTDGFAVAALLAADPERVVHNAVGIFLRHAGTRDPAGVAAFLDEYAGAMPRAAVRLAAEKLPAADRRRYTSTTVRQGMR